MGVSVTAIQATGGGHVTAVEEGGPQAGDTGASYVFLKGVLTDTSLSPPLPAPYIFPLRSSHGGEGLAQANTCPDPRWRPGCPYLKADVKTTGYGGHRLVKSHQHACG